MRRAHDPPDHDVPGRDVLSRSARTGFAPLTSSVAAILALQRQAGNAAVTRAVQRLRSGHDPGHEQIDGHGHEADSGQRFGPEPVQRSTVHEVLRTAGTPLAGSVRRDMEARLGADFSDVRLHTGPLAQRSAAEVGAQAFTSGSHVVIGHGGADRHTLAHELTHVIQQRSGSVAGTNNGHGLRISDPGDAYERAAEANASRALAAPRLEPDTGANGQCHPLQRNVGNATAMQLASELIDVQRMPKKKKKATVETEESRSDDATYEDRVLQALGDKIPNFSNLPRNAQIDFAQNAGIFDVEPDPSDNDFDNYYVAAVMGLIEESTFAPGFEISGGASDWASKKMLAAADHLRENAIPKDEGGQAQWSGVPTMHHKISRARLSTLYKIAMDTGGKDGPARPLFEFLDSIQKTVGSTGYEKILWNMPANVELGPNAGTVDGDPGMGFDPNRIDGRTTPRSSALKEADTMITTMGASPDEGFFEKLAGLLQQAQNEQYETHKGELLSQPRHQQWVRSGEKWKRV